MMQIFDKEWPTRNHLMVAAYCVIAARETGEILPAPGGITVAVTIAHDCDLGLRHTLNIMGNLRIAGLLRYETDGRFGVPPEDCRVFLNRKWMPNVA